MIKNYLLFQAYGKKEVINECKFALLKVLEFTFHKYICPVIYTDNPEHFFSILDRFPDHIIHQITPEEITQWRGEINFVHRVKIEILKNFFSTHSGNLLYCDTDTYFLQCPEVLYENISAGNFYMHLREGFIDHKTHPSFTKWEKFLTNNTSVLSASRLFDVNNIEMWNAGVIGLNSKYVSLLHQVVELTDKVYKQFPKHIAEQFAFSYVFQKNGTIKPADGAIFHYWYLKEYAGYLEKIFLENKNTTPEEIIHKITLLPESLLKEKMTYEKRVRPFKLLLPKWNIKYPS